MLTPDEIRKIDKSSICYAYDKWPEYCKNAFSRDIDVDEKLFDGIGSIVFSGMGGSGTTGDVIADWMRLKCNVPIHIAKNYHVPAFVGEKTLFIAMSVSGGTEETLTTLVEAASAGAKIVAFSQGGEMEQVCKKKGLLHVKIQERLLPRITLPEVLYSVLKLLTYSSFLDGIKDQIQDSIEMMKQVGKKVCQECNYEENPAKQLAGWLLNYIPAAYCSPLQRGVGIRFKNSVNENAKIDAITSEILDACHNELVSWGHKGKENAVLKPILVRNRFDADEISTRFSVFKEMLERSGHEVYETQLQGSTALSNIVSSLYLLDYATIYLGILRKVDPTPITAVFEFKDEMKKRLDYFSKFVKPKLG
ncbi:MAG: SIS domain-containing protein [Nitrososphaerales archaeon]